MKVDGDRPEQLGNHGHIGSAQAAEQLHQQQRLEQQQRVEQQQRLEQQQVRAGERRGDRVELSTDARLADSAVRAATRVPEVRQDVVERARAKLESGELGNDLLQLADKMIDDLLSS